MVRTWVFEPINSYIIIKSYNYTNSILILFVFRFFEHD